MNAIGFLIDADIAPADKEAALLLAKPDIKGRDRQLIITSDAVIKNGELAASLDCFHC